jgi:hypothetical protein
MIDRLVVSRESWVFSAQDLSFAFEKQEAQRFIAARRWVRQQKLPRFLFVKTSTEMKPFYLDLTSPIYVELLARAVRKAYNANSAIPIIFTEMLPEGKLSWLTDAEGKRYLCELRCLVVDNYSGEEGIFGKKKI